MSPGPIVEGAFKPFLVARENIGKEGGEDWVLRGFGCRREGMGVRGRVGCWGIGVRSKVGEKETS